MQDNKVKDKTSLATEPVVLIADAIKQRMEALNRQLVQIEVYDKSTRDTELSEQYTGIISEINAFINYIKIDAFHAVEPEDMTGIKTQVYNHLFSTQASKNVELLCCAEALDPDQMLVAARRARLGNKKQRLLFICDLDFLEKELLQHHVAVNNVTNIGILHHYTSTSVKFDEGSYGKATFSSVSNHNVEQVVKQVFKVVPKFIKERVTNASLKVVLRSCSGAETKEDTFVSLKETKAYPIRILPPSIHILPGTYDPENVPAKTKQEKQKKQTDKAAAGETSINLEQLAAINKYRNEQFTKIRELYDAVEKKGNICIRQDKVGEGQYTTKLYLPYEAKAIELPDVPPLESESSFAQLAKKLIAFLQTKSNNDLHISPYNTSLIIEDKLYSPPHNITYQKGLKKFKEEFGSTASKSAPARGLLAEWEGREPLDKSKVVYKQLFTSTMDLKDAAPMPKNSYASNLLTAIRDCPNVVMFKAYCAGYVAALDRTIHFLYVGSSKPKDRDEDASNPKAIIVSRHGGFFNEEGSEQTTASQSKKEYKC